MKQETLSTDSSVRLKIDIVSLFPEMFSGVLSASLLGKAQAKGLLDIRVHNLRDFSEDQKHHKVDDKQFGGGAGMLLKPEPIYRALQHLGALPDQPKKPWVIFMSPQGRPFSHSVALELSRKERLVILCGHYEGVDERVMAWVDEEISMGDFVLTGGEIPAMALTDAVSRLVPGVVKEWQSVENDSFFGGLLDHSHYTRPPEFMGMKVPDVLLSGDHQEIASWRMEDSLRNTRVKRPDLLSNQSSNKEALQ